MIKTSKVTKVTGNGTWDSQYGLKYKFEIEMENGDIGEYNSKTKDQTKFIVDKTVEYEFKDGQFPKINPVYNYNNNTNNMNKDKVQEYIIRQSSLGRAVEICIARGVYGREDILSEAEFYTDWVLDRNQTRNLPFSN